MIFLNFLLKKYYVFSFYFYEIQNILRLVIQAFPYFKFLKIIPRSLMVFLLNNKNVMNLLFESIILD